MPEHTSFIHYLLNWLFGHTALEENMHRFGHTMFGKTVGAHEAEPLAASLLVAIVLILLAWRVSDQVKNQDKAVIPDEKLSLRTFFEIFIGYFYGMMKDMMGAKRAKRYFPIVGTAACFVFFGNALGLIPGLIPPTSAWDITWGCAIVVFFAFNYYGIKENGSAYFRHLAGPWLGWLGLPINILVFVIELFALFLRPLTLSIRLMVNMAVDHLLVSVTLALVALLVPIPMILLSTLVVVIQVLVFCLLTAIYIALATEHEEHDEHGHAEAHA